MEDYPSMHKEYGQNKDKKLKMWGEKVESLAEVSEVFLQFLSGKINKLPWCEVVPAPETTLINEFLVYLNKNKLLTTTSQPSVNG
jgi:methylenetetrahydrofolate reductase (NADPH)